MLTADGLRRELDTRIYTNKLQAMEFIKELVQEQLDLLLAEIIGVEGEEKKEADSRITQCKNALFLIELCEKANYETSASGLHIADVSVSFLEELQLKVNYHMNSEKDRASVKDYRDAIYHSTCAGAVTDVILMAKRKNKR